MKRISLDSILLLTLVIPFIMTYRLSPAETPYLLFGAILLGSLLYIAMDIFAIGNKIREKSKLILLWIIIALTIGGAFFASIVVRHQTAPFYGVHDIIIQQESAIRFMLHGKNPYSANYFGTPLEEWNYSDKEVNPALYHFVMQPFYLLFPLPFYFFSNLFFGFFDARVALLFLFLLLLISASLIIKDYSKKLQFIILLAFNPAMLGYTLEGRSDIFMYAFLFLGFFLLYKKQYSLGGIITGLAFAVKQSAWPLIPFYIAFLYFNLRDVKKTIRALIPFAVTTIIIIGPFFLWNAKAFLDSTVYYLSGNVEHSYPISGYGLGMVLHQLGFIKNVHDYYPFFLWQIIICIPLLIILLKYLRKSPSVNRLILVYAIFLFIYWYISRYFNNSHLGYLSMVFITAYFWPEKETG